MVASALQQETFVSIVVSIILALIAQIAHHLISNPLISSIVVGSILLGILVSLLIPQIFRLIKNYYVAIERRNFKRQGEIIHQLSHTIRDTCVQSMPFVESYNPPIITIDRRVALPHPNLAKNKANIILSIDYVVELFQDTVPPGTRVWACLRDLRGDDCYHTFVRSGLFNPNRVMDSKPMHKDEGTIALLTACYKSGVCVWITGSEKGPGLWQPQGNDKYGEDKTVMLGAIMTKSWDSEANVWSNNKLAWVLGVCADAEDAFDETHIPLMRGCVDLFSVLANTLLRDQFE